MKSAEEILEEWNGRFERDDEGNIFTNPDSADFLDLIEIAQVEQSKKDIEIIKKNAKSIWINGTSGYPNLIKAIENQERMK